MQGASSTGTLVSTISSTHNSHWAYAIYSKEASASAMIFQGHNHRKKTLQNLSAPQLRKTFN